mgnify:CR=1 FL=1
MIEIVSSDDYHPLKHLAIIMDGNNRWATLRGLAGISGHKAGVERIRGILSSAKSHGIEVVSLFAFSSENWRRPASEVSGLIELFTNYLLKEIDALKADGVRLKIIGNKESNISNENQQNGIDKIDIKKSNRDSIRAVSLIRSYFSEREGCICPKKPILFPSTNNSEVRPGCMKSFPISCLSIVSIPRTSRDCLSFPLASK